MNDSRGGVWGMAAVSLCAAAGLGLDGARAQTLQEALASAYATSPLLKAERAQLRETDERVPQVLANTRPTIQVSASAGSVDETTNFPIGPTTTTATATDGGVVPVNLPRSSYGVSLTQPLFRGGRTLAELREARALVGAERARLVSVEQKVLLQAATTYAEVLRTQNLLALAVNRESVLKAQLDQAQGRYRGGALVRTDLLQTQAAYEGVQAQVASARAQYAAARLAFVRDIGRPAEALDFPAADPTLPSSLEAAQEQAEQQDPDLQSAELLAQAGRQHVRDVAGEALPTVGLQAVAQHQEGANFRGERDDIQAVTLQVRVPIYSGGALASRTRAARDDVAAKDAQVEQARGAAVAAVSSAWEQVGAARSAVAAYAAQVETDTLTLTGTRAQAKGGERTNQDVLIAQQTLFEAQSMLLTARRDLLIATYTLLAASGGLTADGLRLDVARYDPEQNYRRVRWGPGR